MTVGIIKHFIKRENPTEPLFIILNNKREYETSPLLRWPVLRAMRANKDNKRDPLFSCVLLRRCLEAHIVAVLDYGLLQRSKYHYQ